MLAVIWFLFVAFCLSFFFILVLDNNGIVVVKWLSYEIQTDVLTAILVSIFFALLVFSISYLLARILAIRFPKLLKIFFRKYYVKNLEKTIKKQEKTFENIRKALTALESGDYDLAHNMQRKISKVISKSSLNDFLQGEILFKKNNFAKSVGFFTKISDDKNAKILVLKSKFNAALKKKDDILAIAYGQQILDSKILNLDVAKSLFILYKKTGSFSQAKKLVKKYGDGNFKDELQKRDVAVMNCSIAFDHYKKSQYLRAIKFCKIALKSENNFLPAFEIMLKSWLKLGFKFKVKSKIKSLWKENPHLIFAEIFDLANRKKPAQYRIDEMRKLVRDSDNFLSKLALGMVCFRVSSYKEAKEFLQLSLLEQKTHRAYKLLAFVEKGLGNLGNYKKQLKKSKMIEISDHYNCSACQGVFAKWMGNCPSCDEYDSLEWNLS